MLRVCGVMCGLLLAGMVPNVSAGLMKYTVNSGTGTLTGTVGTTSFTNATWELTAIADSANVQTVTYLSNSTYFLPTTVTLTLHEGSNVYTMELVDPSGAQWGVASTQFQVYFFGQFLSHEAGFFMPYDAAASYTGAGTTTGPLYGGDPGLYTDLSVPGQWTGFTNFWGSDMQYTTSLGAFSYSNSTPSVDGYFKVQSIPEPGTLSLLTVAGVALVAFRRRAMNVRR